MHGACVWARHIYGQTLLIKYDNVSVTDHRRIQKRRPQTFIPPPTSACVRICQTPISFDRGLSNKRREEKVLLLDCCVNDDKAMAQWALL